MSDSLVGKGLSFGVAPMEEIGIVQSCTTNNSAEVVEAKDEYGKVIEQKAINSSVEYQIEALISSSSTLPKAGSILNIGTETVLVSSVNITKSNSEYKKVSITASKKDNATLVALAGE